MTRAWLILPLLLFAGCEQRSTEAPDTRRGAELSHLLEGSSPDVARPGDIYRAAYDKARAEITEENASSRLDQIERDIDEELGREHGSSE